MTSPSLLVVLVVVVSWLGAFAIAFGVTEWRSDDGNSGSVVSFDLQTEWVLCVANLIRDPETFAEEEFLGERFVQSVVGRCDPDGLGLDRRWVFCINEEIGDRQLTLGEAQNAADDCAARLGNGDSG